MGERIPGSRHNGSYVLDGLLSAAIKRDQQVKEAADQEAIEAWREFVSRFRDGDFDVILRGHNGREFRVADWDAIDQFIRKG